MTFALPNGCVCCAVRRSWPTRCTAAAPAPARRPAAVPAPGAGDQRARGTGAYPVHAVGRCVPRALVQVDRVVTTIDAVLGAETRWIDIPKRPRRPPWPTAAAHQDRSGAGPGRAARAAGGVEPDGTDRGCGRRRCGRHAVRRLAQGTAAAAASSATAAHAHGISRCRFGLRRPMTRLGFAMALGGLAREHGENLLRVKGLVEFADRAGGPAAIHAVQHTLYPPRWLERWPDADPPAGWSSSCATRAGQILRRFAAGDPACLDPSGRSN